MTKDQPNTERDTQAVTLVEGAIHNPDEPRHFMTVNPAPATASAWINGELVAESDSAVIVREVGRAIYEPIVYFPRGDVRMDLAKQSERTTFCPLKGTTEYFDLAIGDGVQTDAAWSYTDMVLGDELKDLVAFDPATADIRR